MGLDNGLGLFDHLDDRNRGPTKNFGGFELAEVVGFTWFTLIGIELLVVKFSNYLAVLDHTNLGLGMKEGLVDVENCKSSGTYEFLEAMLYHTLNLTYFGKNVNGYVWNPILSAALPA